MTDSNKTNRPTSSDFDVIILNPTINLDIIINAARNGRMVDSDIADAIHRNPDVSGLSPHDAFEKIGELLSCDGDIVTKMLIEFSDVIASVIPELKPCVGHEQLNEHHAYDVYTHSAVAVGKCGTDDLTVRWTLLLHDIGKPDAEHYDEKKGRMTAAGHDRIGANIACNVLNRLGADKQFVNDVCLLIAEHQDLHDIHFTKRGVRRLMGRLATEEMWDRWVHVRIGDTLAHSQSHIDSDEYGMAAIEKAVRLHDEIVASDDIDDADDLGLMINGNDLIGIGYEQGRALGDVLSNVRILVADGYLDATRDAQMRYDKNKLTELRNDD